MNKKEPTPKCAKCAVNKKEPTLIEPKALNKIEKCNIIWEKNKEIGEKICLQITRK